MAGQRRRKQSETRKDAREFEYRRHRVRVEEGDTRRVGEEEFREAKLFINDIEIPIEVSPRGVVSHDEMAFKEYGTVDELAEDIIRQRGTAEIVKGETPPHHDPHH